MRKCKKVLTIDLLVKYGTSSLCEETIQNCEFCLGLYCALLFVLIHQAKKIVMPSARDEGIPRKFVKSKAGIFEKRLL